MNNFLYYLFTIPMVVLRAQLRPFDAFVPDVGELLNYLRAHQFSINKNNNFMLIIPSLDSIILHHFRTWKWPFGLGKLDYYSIVGNVEEANDHYFGALELGMQLWTFLYAKLTWNDGENDTFVKNIINWFENEEQLLMLSPPNTFHSFCPLEGVVWKKVPSFRDVFKESIKWKKCKLTRNTRSKEMMRRRRK